MGKLSPLSVTGAASLLLPGKDPDPRPFRHVSGSPPCAPSLPRTQTPTRGTARGQREGSKGSERLAVQWTWVFPVFSVLETGEGWGGGTALGRQGGGGEAGDRAPRAALAPSLGRDRQLLSNRQRPEIYLKRGKGEENKGGGGGRRAEPGRERASREDPPLRGHIKRSHLYTPRSMGRMDNICQLQTFLFPVPGEGRGRGKGRGRGGQTRRERPPQGQRASRCSHTETQSHESPGIFLLLSLLIIFYYSTAASERSAAPLPRLPAASLC